MLNVKFDGIDEFLEVKIMKIAVCIKQAIDVAQLRIDPATKEPIIAAAPRKMSDIDRNAVEEAVRLKEKYGGSISALTVGTEKAKEVLKEALAMGADEAYLICDEKLKNIDTHLTAKALASAIKKIGTFDIILCGEITIDTYSGQVGPRIAELLDVPCITHVKSIQVNGTKVTVERDLEDKYEVIETEMPVLLTVTKEINVPRLPPLMAILRAARKQITILNVESLGLEVEESGVEIIGVQALEMERKMYIIKDKPAEEAVQELIELLAKEGVLEV